MSEFKEYRRRGTSMMRPYVPGEDLTHVSVSEADTPGEGGMIARNPTDHSDQWYVAAEWFQENFELIE